MKATDEQKVREAFEPVIQEHIAKLAKIRESLAFTHCVDEARVALDLRAEGRLRIAHRIVGMEEETK